MGVLNITPDSFSDGGEFFSQEAALDRAFQMVEEGADILDIGGESSRPGAELVSEEEELRRIFPVIEKLGSSIATPISVDTYKASVAEACLEAGASIINDISALRFDKAMAEVVTNFEAFLVLMHMKGTPQNMQEKPYYNDILFEVETFFQDRLDIANLVGIEKRKLILDPGIGFGKTAVHNFTILRYLERFTDFGIPLLVGPSRKSFIGMTLDLPESQRLEGTAAAITASILNGAKIIRVHDVMQMKRVITITDSIKSVGGKA